MKFKLDENLPLEAALLLRQAGHDALTVLDEHLGGKPDEEIAIVCQQEQRILLTLDTDFANIRLYEPKNYPGIIVLRLKRQNKTHVLSVIEKMIFALPKEKVNRKLWIVEEKRIRIKE